MNDKKIVASMSQTNIERLTKTESDFQKLKNNRAEDYQSIQEKKLDQYATVISHLKPIYDQQKTASNNLPRDVGIAVREDLMNDVGQSKANAKVLYERSVLFLAKFTADVPTQATPDAVLTVFSNMEIKSQNDLKKKVVKEQDQDLAEQIARKLFGKVKTQKTKDKDDNVVEEKVYIPTDLTSAEVQAIWEVLEDKRRERQEHDKASAKAQKKISEDNDIIAKLDKALAS